MTLILGLKFKGGSLIASDRRTMIGDLLMREGEAKVERLSSDIAVATAGLTGACDDILRAVKAFCSSNNATSFDSISSCVSDTTLDYYKKNKEKLEDDEEDMTIFLVGGLERIRKTMGRGYTEEVSVYDCDGTGKPYAEYILRNSYRVDLSEQEAKELAVYAISETSKIDPNVGNDMDIAVCRKESGCTFINQTEIENIRARLAPLSRTGVEEQIRVVEHLVNVRQTINEFFDSRFRFKLFNPNEKAIFQIMKPCRNEEEFTNNISALALLITQINIKEMKLTAEKDGSINCLEEFMKSRLGKCPDETIQAFRDVMTLRSKKFPIHSTDSLFVEVVIKVTGKYPVEWAQLYSKTLSSVEHGLEKLCEFLSITEH